MKPFFALGQFRNPCDVQKYMYQMLFGSKYCHHQNRAGPFFCVKYFKYTAEEKYKKNSKKECIERSLETYTYHVYCLLSSGFSHTAITVQQRKKCKIEFHDYSEMIKLFVGRASIRRMKSNSLKSVELRMQDAGYYAFPHMLFVQSFYTSQLSTNMKF